MERTLSPLLVWTTVFVASVAGRSRMVLRVNITDSRIGGTIFLASSRLRQGNRRNASPVSPALVRLALLLSKEIFSMVFEPSTMPSSSYNKVAAPISRSHKVYSKMPFLLSGETRRKKRLSKKKAVEKLPRVEKLEKEKGVKQGGGTGLNAGIRVEEGSSKRPLVVDSSSEEERKKSRVESPKKVVSYFELYHCS